jgi:pyruvate/2-oxoglutarate dehydrogenase complex dihydrolipoamide acyltransferase (E2) component
MNERPKAPAAAPAEQSQPAAAGQPSPQQPPQQPPQAEPQQPVGFTPDQHRAARGLGIDLSRIDPSKISAIMRLLASLVDQLTHTSGQSAR